MNKEHNLSKKICTFYKFAKGGKNKSFCLDFQTNLPPNNAQCLGRFRAQRVHAGHRLDRPRPINSSHHGNHPDCSQDRSPKSKPQYVWQSCPQALSLRQESPPQKWTHHDKCEHDKTVRNHLNDACFGASGCIISAHVWNCCESQAVNTPSHWGLAVLITSTSLLSPSASSLDGPSSSNTLFKSIAAICTMLPW